MRERGLTGIRLVIGDHHSGLVGRSARSCSVPPTSAVAFIEAVEKQGVASVCWRR
uniref:hypothetical protein n=1 Tax=Streptomyces marianii TaxID=1817406 RepID=UPI002D77D019|nr:hypothetical protein [Streptomyces marianii]